MTTVRLILSVCLLFALVEAQTWRAHGSHGRRQPAPSPPSVQIPSPPDSGLISVADQIASDMTGTNEGHPHGVPSSWDFYSGPTIGQGNNPGSNTAYLGWGVVYVDTSNVRLPNTRVNIRACETFWKSNSTGKWTPGGRTDAPEAGAYPENFSGPGTSASIRNENDGSISILAGSGRVTHFYWPYPRVPIRPSDVGGIVAVCQMRLILANPSATDDRAGARYLGSVGADYYPAPTGPGIENNPAIGEGKMKYVGVEWRSFSMTTIPKAELKSNPPPIDLTGVLP